MVDEKLLPPPHSTFELEEVPLPKQYPFKLQSALYQLIAKDMHYNPSKYKKLERQKQKELIDFWIAFLKRNKYLETAQETEFHQAVLCFL